MTFKNHYSFCKQNCKRVLYTGKAIRCTVTAQKKTCMHACIPTYDILRKYRSFSNTEEKIFLLSNSIKTFTFFDRKSYGSHTDDSGAQDLLIDGSGNLGFRELTAKTT